MAEVSRDRDGDGGHGSTGEPLAAWWGGVPSISRAGGLHGEMGCSQH